MSAVQTISAKIKN